MHGIWQFKGFRICHVYAVCKAYTWHTNMPWWKVPLKQKCMKSICLSYANYMSGICLVNKCHIYARHIHGIWHGERFHVNINIWKVYIYHMPITCLAYAWHMNMITAICLAYAQHICLTYANHTTFICLAYMPGIYVAYTWHITCARHMPDIR